MTEINTFKSALDQWFPGALLEEDFLNQTTSALEELGLSRESTIAAVGLCRDEMCRSLSRGIGNRWGEPFKFSSLAGMVFCGKTGFGAFHHHSPVKDGLERYVYFAMPHIGIGPNGEIGEAERINRPGKSGACGALLAFMGELKSGNLDLQMDLDDMEQSMLKAHMLRKMSWGSDVDLLSITRTAHTVILEDLERMIEMTNLADTDTPADYGVITGVQVHGPDGQQWVWPGTIYAVIGGTRHDISLG